MDRSAAPGLFPESRLRDFNLIGEYGETQKTAYSERDGYYHHGTAAKIRILEQLIKPGPEPLFGPPKNGRSRTIHLGADTLRLLKEHRRHQAELKLRNRQHYHDHGLVFAKEWEHLFRGQYTIGDPLQMNNLGQREFKKITEAASVRRIKFHGLRHTCATLLLQAGVPVKVVSERLGHKRAQITMDVYQHVLPDMQEDAAEALNAVLFG